MEAHRFNVEMRNAQRSDQMDLRDLLVRIVKDVDDIKKLVTLESPTYPVVEKVMESLQTVGPGITTPKVLRISYAF